MTKIANQDVDMTHDWELRFDKLLRKQLNLKYKYFVKYQGPNLEVFKRSGSILNYQRERVWKHL